MNFTIVPNDIYCPGVMNMPEWRVEDKLLCGKPQSELGIITKVYIFSTIQ